MIDLIEKMTDRDMSAGYSDFSKMELEYKKLEMYYRIKLIIKTIREQIFNEKK